MAAPTVGSLFSGIGGIDLGLERAGFETKWQVEIDPFARSILQKHWSHVPKFEDVTKIEEGDLEPVDLVCGGFPCQPVSDAGLKLAQDDPRWLWPYFRGILGFIRPRLVLVENVEGLLGRGLGDVLGDLSRLGYDAQWATLPAAFFGAPHQRNRIYLVAYPDSIGRQAGDVFHSVTSRSYDISALQLEQGFGGRVRAFPPSLFERMDDGFPSELDIARLKAYGNAVYVPQVEWIGRRIREVFSL